MIYPTISLLDSTPVGVFCDEHRNVYTQNQMMLRHVSRTDILDD